MPTRNLAILFTDMKGFTARVSGAGRDELTRLRQRHDALLLPVFRHFNGHVVKSIGDAFLVCFDTPTESVLCGMTIQEVLRQHNQTLAESDRIEVRIAINCGEVERSDDDVLGDTVNVAARLEEVAEVGEVYFTESVYLAMNRNEAPSAEVGELRFRGIPYPVRVYRALQQPDSRIGMLLAKSVHLTEHGPVIDLPKRASNGSPRLSRLVAAGALVASLAIGALWFATRSDAADQALATATDLRDQNKPLIALETLKAELARRPDHAGLRQAAGEAGRAHLASLRESSGPGEALAWLRRELAASSCLEELRPLTAELDAEDGLERMLRNVDDPSLEIDALLKRHPQDPSVALTAARGLRGKAFSYYPIGLYITYLERGGEPLPEILDYCQRLLAVFAPTTPVAQRTLDLLRRWYPTERITWARTATLTSPSGRVLENALRILAEVNDPLATDPLTLNLFDLVDGYADDDAAAQAVAFFQTQDPARQEQVLGLHRWVLAPDVPWGGQRRDLVATNLAALESAWSK